MAWLTEQELYGLTKYRWPSKQIKWLKRHGVRHFVAADGHPRVMWGALQEQKQGVGGPNLEAVRSLRKVR